MPYFQKIYTFASSLVSIVEFPQGIKRECRETRQQFPLL